MWSKVWLTCIIVNNNLSLTLDRASKKKNPKTCHETNIFRIVIAIKYVFNIIEFIFNKYKSFISQPKIIILLIIIVMSRVFINILLNYEYSIY